MHDHPVLDRLTAAAKFQQFRTDRGVVHLGEIAGEHLVGDPHRGGHRAKLHAQELRVARAHINRAGAEAFKIAVGAIPMLVLSLVVVARKRSGVIDLLTQWLTPLLTIMSVDLGARSYLP